ncbi:MAG: hypothetical protein RL119_1358, partial [Actinomycetota bacterium]
EVVGGIVGYAIFEDADLPTGLVRTYALGAVTGTTAGGLLGFRSAGVNVVGSYWNKDANATLAASGINESGLSDPLGSTLLELQDIDTYSSWSIIDGWVVFSPPSAVWGICDGDGTPYLLWEEAESPCGTNWTVDGFFNPVDMNDIVNVAQAGRAVPLKWRVRDEAGDPVSDASSFVSMTTSTFSCLTSSVVVQDGVESYTGGSGLRYLGDGYWQFNWATPKSYAGHCRTVTLELSDGSTISAKFRFRR